ncbi:MAG: ABC transporter ATP-binding protein [Planctomycetota bacterium]|nr:ABC transporter ATP-binding protein [Planctomycetota bacterium]
MSLLQIRSLSKHYGAVRALDGIDIDVGEARIHGFLGPNGAGKTTAIRILAGLIRPTAGSVTLGALDLLGDRTQAAMGLRALVEVPAFYPGLTGFENLQVFAKLARAPRGDVERLLNAVGLTAAAKRAVGGYSLGIAQALVGRPRLVVLDEPMNGLDPAAIHLVRELVLAERAAHGVTFFLSSHLLHDVETLCDEVSIIHRGQVVAGGNIEGLLGHAVSGFHIHTADDTVALRALTRVLPGAKPRIHADGGIEVDGDDALVPALHRTLLEVGVPALSIAPMRETLERYFIEKTEGVMG